jgi:hypothetical protein
MEESFPKQKKYFSFAKINKYFIFPFISPIFIFIRELLLEYSKGKTSGIRKILQYEFNDGLMHSSCILFYIFIYFRTKTEKTKEESDYYKKIANNNIYSKKIRENKFKIFFIILTIAIGYNNYISSKMLLKGKTIFEIRIYHVIFNTIFCKIILGYEIYKHQLLSLILILIGWVFISIPVFIKLTTDDIYYNVLFFFGAIFYPLYLALLKYIIENYYISIYLDMFFIGAILLILSTVLTIINSTFVYSDFSDLINIFDSAYNKILLFFAFFSGTIVKFIFCIIIENFSPNIFVLTNVISSIITWIYNVGFKKKPDTTSNIICLSIGYFIILISCFIYNEIIILNFFNLNENTNFNIKERNVNDRLLSENFAEIELNDIGDYYLKNDSNDNRDTKGRKSDSF